MKPATRKSIEKEIIDTVNEVDPSGTNGNMYKVIFKTMSDEALDKLIAKPIPIYAPNGSDVKLDHMRNVSILRERFGYETFQRVWLTDPRTGACSLTKYRHMVLPIPVRRQTQLIDKKASIPEHNRTVDSMTGQATGASKGSSFSFPQIYVMFAKGYDATIKEFISTRGGNNEAGRVIDRQIRQHGNSSQKFEGSHRTRAKSIKTLGILFRVMHIGNNMGKTK